MAKRTGIPIPDRVAERAATKYVVNADGCWISTYSSTGSGHRKITWPDEHGVHRGTTVHRAAYQHHTGQPIGPANDVDHMCHDPAVCSGGDRCPHRACVNPAHLAEATHQANVLRGGGPAAQAAAREVCSVCGGPFHQYADRRRCKRCKGDEQRRRRARRKVASAA